MFSMELNVMKDNKQHFLHNHVCFIKEPCKNAHSCLHQDHGCEPLIQMMNCDWLLKFAYCWDLQLCSWRATILLSSSPAQTHLLYNYPVTLNKLISCLRCRVMAPTSQLNQLYLEQADYPWATECKREFCNSLFT